MKLEKLDIFILTILGLLLVSLAVNIIVISRSNSHSKENKALVSDMKKMEVRADSAMRKAFVHERRADSLERLAIKIDSNNTVIVQKYVKDQERIASMSAADRHRMADSIVSSRLRISAR